MAGGGTTTVEVTRFGEVVNAYTSLNGTQMNCAGGRMPWGSWVTCEETVNGPDVGPDFTGASNVPLTKPHGFIFEVPAGGESNRRPITAAGRFAHEAVALDPLTGALYMTEDNFGFPSGFYRYLPPRHPLPPGGSSTAAASRCSPWWAPPGRPGRLAAGRRQLPGHLGRHRGPQPDVPLHARPDRPDPERRGAQPRRRARGARRARPGSRGSRAPSYDRGTVYFTSTQGGGPAEPGDSDTVGGWGNGSGQVWGYDTCGAGCGSCTSRPAPEALDLPDNVTTGRTGTLVLCEDSSGDNYLRGLSPDGAIWNLALNRLVSSTGTPRFGDEFAGATFSPDGQTLFVNIQASRGMSFAIWGPWSSVGM